MKKILVAVVAALLLVAGLPAVAQAGGGSGGSGWPVASAPLPAGTIVSQSSSKAVVLSPSDVRTTVTALDAAYVARGWTVGASSGIPRWYRRSGTQVDAFFAALDGGQSYWTLRRH